MKLEPLHLTIEHLSIKIEEPATAEAMKAEIVQSVLDWMNTPDVMARLNDFAATADDNPERARAAHG